MCPEKNRTRWPTRAIKRQLEPKRKDGFRRKSLLTRPLSRIRMVTRKRSLLIETTESGQKLLLKV